MNLSDYAYIPDYWETTIVMGTFAVSLIIGIYILREIVGNVNLEGLIVFAIFVVIFTAGVKTIVYHYNITSLNSLITAVDDNFDIEINEIVAVDISNHGTSDEYSNEFVTTYDGKEKKIIYLIKDNTLIFYKIDLDIITRIDSK